MRTEGGLPKGWVEAALGELAVVNPRRPESAPKDEQQVSFVPMAAVEAMSGRMDSTETRAWNDVKKGYTCFQSDDVLVAKITPSMENGKAAVARNLVGGVGAGSTEFHVLRPSQALHPDFLLHTVLKDDFRREARSQMTGTAGQLRVPSRFLEQSKIKVPPVAEQRRIVQALDSYLSRLDDAAATLERVQRNLERYRASVLKAAVEGRLVPTEAELARAEGREYETATSGLDRILAERWRQWEEVRSERKGGRGQQQRYPEPKPAELEGFADLPEGWCWASVSQLGFIASGQTPEGLVPSLRPTGDVPWFRVGDMNTDGNDPFLVRPGGWLTTPEADQLGLHVRPAGTIVFPKRGGAIATNKKRILGVNAAYDLNTMGITPVGELGPFLWMYFLGIDLASRSDGSSIPQINHTDIEPLAVPLPPEPERFRIVEKVTELLSSAAVVTSTVSLSLARLSRLRQSILKSAFEGKLVDQDPTDEPASDLLARIRAEHAAAPAPKPRQRRSKISR